MPLHSLAGAAMSARHIGLGVTVAALIVALGLLVQLASAMSATPPRREETHPGERTGSTTDELG